MQCILYMYTSHISSHTTRLTLHPILHIIPAYAVDHAADAAHGPSPQEGEPQPAPTHLPRPGCDSDRRHYGVRTGFVCFLCGMLILS